MFLYNSMTGQKEKFEPIDDVVKFYACGPTVYGIPHIGNARAAFVADFLRRSLVFLGYDVKFVSNFTDIDDKIINKANEDEITVKDLAKEMANMALKTNKILRINEPDVRTYATKFVDEMIDFVRVLMEKDIAYQIENDGIYFRIDKYDDYGKLSKQNLEDLKVGERIEENISKENPRDFVLWKFKKEGEPFWEDRKGEIADGRPGWHIECSVMIEEALGTPIDIHAGGEDLKFPHHECEIAQSESVTGQELAKFWVHNGYVNMSGQKMSKSLGNIKTVLDLVKLYDPLDLRYFLMSVHYRSPIDFTDKNIKQASQSRVRLQNLWDRLNDIEEFGEDGVDDEFFEDFESNFEEALSDDLNISQALAEYFEFIKHVNSFLDEENLNKDSIENIKEVMLGVDEVLGVLRIEKIALNDKQKALFEKRVEARRKKDYEESDRLRDELLELGVQVMDSADGTTYRVIL